MENFKNIKKYEALKSVSSDKTRRHITLTDSANEKLEIMLKADGVSPARTGKYLSKLIEIVFSERTN